MYTVYAYTIYIYIIYIGSYRYIIIICTHDTG